MSRWFGVAVLALAFILVAPALAAEEDPVFASERADRLHRIDYELGQIAVEQARLETERLALARERRCAAKAKSREAIKACARQ